MRLVAFFSFFLISWGCMAIDLVAHRGNAGGALENSVAAVLASAAAGANVIELDVQISKDNVVYLFHDKSINGKNVVDLTYDQIVKITTSERVPRLENVLSLNSFNGIYLLDLKFSSVKSLDVLAQTIRSTVVPMEQIIIQSSDVAMLAHGNQILPKCQYFYLERLSRTFPFFAIPVPEKILEKVNDLDIQGISVKGRRFLNSEYISLLKSTGLRIYVWTINDIERAKYYTGIGVDGVITDSLEEMRKMLSEMIERGDV